MSDSHASMINELSSNRNGHLRVSPPPLLLPLLISFPLRLLLKSYLPQALDHESKEECAGDMSLQHGLELAGATLSFVPSHGCREVVLIHSSKSSIDPSDIFVTLRELKAKVGDGAS